MTKEDHETPSNAELIADDPDDPYEEQGEYSAGKSIIVLAFFWHLSMSL